MNDQRLKSRFQVLLALTFFLPVVIASLGGDPKAVSGNVLNWGAVVAIVITSYLLLELLGEDNLGKWPTRILQFLIFINIASYVPLLILIAQYHEVLKGALAVIGFFVALQCAFWIPVIIFAVLGVTAFPPVYRFGKNLADRSFRK